MAGQGSDRSGGTGDPRAPGAGGRAELARELLRAQMALDHWLRPWVRRERLGLSPSLTLVLHLIRDEPTPTLRRLADRLDVTPTAITSITDRLESLGYVRRVRTPDDRRRTQLEITRAGREMSVEIEDSFVRDIESALVTQESDRLAAVREAARRLGDFVAEVDRSGAQGAEARLPGGEPPLTVPLTTPPAPETPADRG